MIRIMRVCPAPGYIRQFREKHGLKSKPFADQVKILQAENVYLPGGWASCMHDLGFEAFDCLYDDIELAARWAEEHHVAHCFRHTNPLFEVLTHQIRTFEPDIIIFQTGAMFQVDRLHRTVLRNLLSKPVVIAGVWGDEVPHGHTYDSYFGDLNFVFTVNTTYQRNFENAGIRAYTIGSGFDESIRYTAPTTKSFDLITCGETGYNKIDHINRYEVLCKIAAATDIRIFASEPKAWPFRRRSLVRALDTIALLPEPIIALLGRVLSISRMTRGGRAMRAVNFVQRMKLTGASAADLLTASKDPRANYFLRKKPLKVLFPSKVAKGPLESSKYHQLLASSKIILNIHRDESADYGNLRCFEATGVGSLLLTDHGDALKEFFNVAIDIERDEGASAAESAEVVAFTGANDCLRKIDFLRKHPGVVERIAQRGQQRTLKDHTVLQRCRSMKPILLEEHAKALEDHARADPIVVATYDTHYYPIGWDMSFFVEAAEITRRKCRGKHTIINVLYPIESSRLPGVPDDYLAAIDRHGLEFRIMHICGQIAQMFPAVTVNLIRNRDMQLRPNNQPVIDFPGTERPHHTEYYRIVNQNPNLVRGFSASRQACRYIEQWLSTFLHDGKRLICVTIRDYMFDKQRNSNLPEWRKFVDSLDKNLYEIVFVPDSEQMAKYQLSPLGKYRAFWPACFDVDLRFALYEAAYLNLGVNNGPMTTSSLNKNVRYLTFKLLAAGVPHCTEEFIAWSGYPVNGSPGYGTKFQKWVWEDDSFPVIRREFDAMVASIEESTKPALVSSPVEFQPLRANSRG